MKVYGYNIDKDLDLTDLYNKFIDSLESGEMLESGQDIELFWENGNLYVYCVYELTAEQKSKLDFAVNNAKETFDDEEDIEYL